MRDLDADGAFAMLAHAIKAMVRANVAEILAERERAQPKPAPRPADAPRPAKPILTPAEAASFLGISSRTLARLRASGDIPAHTTGANGHARYKRDDLQAWLEKPKQAPVAAS
jgi:excisionase family DNA binding protein